METLGICLVFGTNSSEQLLFKRAIPKITDSEKSEDNWTATYFYPFVTSKDEKSEWHKAFHHQQTATKDALSVELQKGKITSGVPVEEVKNSLFAMAHITELK